MNWIDRSYYDDRISLVTFSDPQWVLDRPWAWLHVKIALRFSDGALHSEHKTISSGKALGEQGERQNDLTTALLQMMVGWSLDEGWRMVGWGMEDGWMRDGGWLDEGWRMVGWWLEHVGAIPKSGVFLMCAFRCNWNYLDVLVFVVQDVQECVPNLAWFDAFESRLQMSYEPRSKLPAIDFCLRWNLFFKKLNGVTRAQAFRKLRASSCTRKLRASPKSSRYFKDKYMNIQQEGLHNMMCSGFQRCSGNFAQGSRKLRASKGVPAHYMPHRNP